MISLCRSSSRNRSSSGSESRSSSCCFSRVVVVVVGVPSESARDSVTGTVSVTEISHRYHVSDLVETNTPMTVTTITTRTTTITATATTATSALFLEQLSGYAAVAVPATAASSCYTAWAVTDSRPYILLLLSTLLLGCGAGLAALCPQPSVTKEVDRIPQGKVSVFILFCKDADNFSLFSSQRGNVVMHSQFST